MYVFREFVLRKPIAFVPSADQVFGDEEMHATVRQNCMDYIVKNADFFRSYITEDFDHYISRKRRQHCHGNHIEMIALSELYNRPIEVYEYSIGKEREKHLQNWIEIVDFS